MQKLLKCHASRLGCRDQVVILREGGSASASSRVRKSREYFARVNIPNILQLLQDRGQLWKSNQNLVLETKIM